MRALLISTYDLGHQPFGLASPAAWLRGAGVDVQCVDLAREPLPANALESAQLIAVYLPMHTATRLAIPVIQRARRQNPSARICAYGLYAPLNAEWLRALGVTDILGGEFESALAAIALGPETEPGTPGPALPRLRFLTPDRSTLPPLGRYASVHLGDGTSRIAGYTEASRGCRHLCRHCPVVPVYQGQFRVVQPEVVLADVAAQVAAGATHITFGDPDFFNGPTHALRIVRGLAAAHPSVSYDVTIKIEHLLAHRDQLGVLRDTGCVFITSAVESLDDLVLMRLEKGHTRAHFLEAVALCREEGLTLVPTFVPFHPWTTLASYCELLDTIESLGLVDHVAPIQLAIRLLIPEGSRMLELEDVRARVRSFDRQTLAYPWTHADLAVDRLHQDVTALVGGRLATDRRGAFDEISDLAHARAGVPRPPCTVVERAHVPYMDEPWYCCAEPNPDQLRLV